MNLSEPTKPASPPANSGAAAASPSAAAEAPLTAASPTVASPAAETSVPSYAEMARFTLPIVLALATHAINNLVDAAFVGQLGTEPLAALAIANWSYIAAMVLLLGLTRSAMTFLSQSYGAGQPLGLGQWISQYQWIVLGSWPILIALVQGFPYVAEAAHLSPVAAQQARTFLSIRMWELPLALTSVLYGTMYNATGRSTFPMAMQWTSVVLNVTLNYGLTLGHYGWPRLGIVGSATSTLISQCVTTTLVLTVTYLGPLRRKHGLKPLRRPDPAKLLRILRVGAPQGLADGLELVGFLVFFTIVGRLGEAALAASNIGMQVTHVLFMPAIAMGIGAASYAGRFVGAGVPEMARVTTHRILRLTAGYMGVLGIPLWFYGRTITSWFISDPAVVDQAEWVFKVMAAYQAFDALGIVLRVTLAGAGDTRYPMAVVGASAALALVPLTWWWSTAVTPGILGAWLAMFVYVLVLGLALLWRFERGAWMRMGVVRAGSR
jgi:multidrug resistance protein, MATE family